MDTSGETTFSIPRVVLKQVQKDGITYRSLAKAMATIILNEMKDDGLPDELTFIAYGTLHDMGHVSEQDIARRIEKETDIPVYASKEGSSQIVSGLGELYVTNLRRWNFGE